jgi:hypothetical protein
MTVPERFCTILCQEVSLVKAGAAEKKQEKKQKRILVRSRHCLVVLALKRDRFHITKIIAYILLFQKY